MALSTRLRTSTASRASSPCTGQGGPSCSSRAWCFSRARGAASASSRRVMACRSTSPSFSMASASSRDRVSSCCTSRVARSQPSSVCCRALRRCVSFVSCRATCAWARMAAMGVRSSWAASAVKRRSDSSSVSMRWNKAFSASTMGSISEGAPSTCTRSSASGRRSSSARPRPRKGRRPRCTAHHTASTSKGRASTRGHKVLRSTAQRMALRDFSCSPTYTCKPLAGSCTAKTRQRALSISTVWKPAPLPPATRGLVGALADRSTRRPS